MPPTFWMNAIDAAHAYSSPESKEVLAMLGQEPQGSPRPRAFLWSMADRIERSRGRLAAERKINRMARVLGFTVRLVRLALIQHGIHSESKIREVEADLALFLCKRIEHAQGV